MKTILVSAYAVNPYKGSEDGTGWNFILQIARFQKVIAITRCNNKAAIDRYIDETQPEYAENIQFVYFDLPYWMRFWKRGGKGALLYFYMWQMFLPAFVKRRKLRFDIVHNLNFHADWAPSFLWLMGKPLVWGPVGHHPKIPLNYLRKFGYRAIFADRLKWCAKKMLWLFDPFLKLSAHKSETILAINSSVEKVLLGTKAKIKVLPAVSCGLQISKNNRIEEAFTVMSIGRFVPLKGFDITVNAFATFLKTLKSEERKHAKLQLIGKGPLKTYLQLLVSEHMIAGNVEFIEWLPQSELKTLYAHGSVFLFPSHEGAGMVVPEAMANGLPVLCFNNEGPGEIAGKNSGYRFDYVSEQENIAQFANALTVLYRQEKLRRKLGQNAQNRFRDYLTWDYKGKMLKEVYDEVKSYKGR